MTRKFLKWIRSKLTINETYFFRGTMDELLYALNQLSNSRKWVDEFNAAHDQGNVYSMSPTVSWGTMGIGASITIYIQYERHDDTAQRVKIYTQVRPEMWLSVPLFALISIAIFIQESNIWTIILVPPILIISILWFNFIYKIQEEALIKKVRKKIKLFDR
jgi:hypothetical protein